MKNLKRIILKDGLPSIQNIKTPFERMVEWGLYLQAKTIACREVLKELLRGVSVRVRVIDAPILYGDIDEDQVAVTKDGIVISPELGQYRAWDTDGDRGLLIRIGNKAILMKFPLTRKPSILHLTKRVKGLRLDGNILPNDCQPTPINRELYEKSRTPLEVGRRVVYWNEKELFQMKGRTGWEERIAILCSDPGRFEDIENGCLKTTRKGGEVSNIQDFPYSPLNEFRPFTTRANSINGLPATDVAWVLNKEEDDLRGILERARNLDIPMEYRRNPKPQKPEFLITNNLVEELLNLGILVEEQVGEMGSVFYLQRAGNLVGLCDKVEDNLRYVACVPRGYTVVGDELRALTPRQLLAIAVGMEDVKVRPRSQYLTAGQAAVVLRVLQETIGKVGAFVAPHRAKWYLKNVVTVLHTDEAKEYELLNQVCLPYSKKGLTKSPWRQYLKREKSYYNEKRAAGMVGLLRKANKAVELTVLVAETNVPEQLWITPSGLEKVREDTQNPTLPPKVHNEPIEGAEMRVVHNLDGTQQIVWVEPARETRHNPKLFTEEGLKGVPRQTDQVIVCEQEVDLVVPASLFRDKAIPYPEGKIVTYQGKLCILANMTWYRSGAEYEVMKNTNEKRVYKGLTAHLLREAFILAGEEPPKWLEPNWQEINNLLATARELPAENQTEEYSEYYDEYLLEE